MVQILKDSTKSEQKVNDFYVTQKVCNKSNATKITVQKSVDSRETLGERAYICHSVRSCVAQVLGLLGVQNAYTKQHGICR